MAKDGTVRGGARQGSGKKRRDLAGKLIEGKTAKVIKKEKAPERPALPEPEELVGSDMPPVDEWLREGQKEQGTWMAEEIVCRTYSWLKERGCERIVTMQQIYSYATAAARWVQCQRAISLYGFLAKHPTTKAPIESPYVRMADRFFKEQAAAWFSIAQIVKENCAEEISGVSPLESVMNGLLAK